METLHRYGEAVVEWFHPFYTDDGSPQEARMQMHVEDYDAGKWIEGEPAFLRKWKAKFLRQVSREYTCDACKSSFTRRSFARKMLDNSTSLGRKLVCTRCTADGFSPKDCTPYSCAGSILDDESHTAGHLAFAPTHCRSGNVGVLLVCAAKRAEGRSASPLRASA